MAWNNDVSGPTGNLDYRVAHGVDWAAKGGLRREPPAFVLVRNAGTGEADGVYKPAERRWLDHDVYENRYGDCIISREAHKSPKTGEVKHGFVLGKDGRPLYGAKTEKNSVPAKGWRVFQGHEPAPEIQIFQTWSDTCQHGAWYFSQEAENAAKGGHWKVTLMMADRAFDCHTSARPKGRGDIRGGGSEWSEQLCELLGTRSEALLHLGEYKRALVDACAAVHFVAAFDWSKARTRGITACLNLGVEEPQAKLLMDEMCKRNDREFPGVKALEPVVEVMVERARKTQLRPVVIRDETPDDGRLYFKVVDPEDCTLYSRPDKSAKVLGKREFNDVVRGEIILKHGTWLELHVAEAYDDSIGHRKAYAVIKDDGPEDEAEEYLERLPPREYPRKPRWEELGLTVRPLGLKPPTDAQCPGEHGKWQDPDRNPNQKVWPYIYKHGLAIGTMLRGVSEGVIDSFVRYHWLTGWNHIFLFFDDPEDAGIGHAKALEEHCTTKKMDGVGLTVVRMDAEWWEEVKKTSRFYQRREKSDMYETVWKMHEKYRDVESRQMIAMDQALIGAHQMGIDWFAHIDIDECVYVPKLLENSARRYLGAQERSVEVVRLFNHEAVPEHFECQDWFRECTLFQVNKFHSHGFKPPREYDQLLRRKEGREFEPEKTDPETTWREDLLAKIRAKRQACAQRLGLELHGGPKAAEDRPAESFAGFVAQEDGRSIVRLDRHFDPPLPWGSYGFLAGNGDMLREVHQANRRHDPVVLHYPNAGFSNWKQKYQALGQIPHAVAGQRGVPRMHLASSQVVLQKDRKDQEQFYRTFIMQNESSELAVLAEHGLLVRVPTVRGILEYYDNPPEEPEQLPGKMEWTDTSSGLKLARSLL
uniref:Glycosyltransferase family 92 protein n=2 Tax=Alexandrium monilatum TaxID=311494 RepID=A0A7S4PWH1_9DINO